MGKTLAQLRTSLGSMIGFPTITDLDDDEQVDIDTIINAAYLECYAERGGRRPKWIEKTVADIVKAPTTATIGVTNGSTAVTGFGFEAKYAGSFVKIGEKFYRFGGIASGPAYHLAQPWDGTTGNVEATIYYNAVKLPGTVIDVCEGVTLMGVGPLAPIPTPEDEVAIRSAPAFDFNPRRMRAPFAHNRPRFDPNLFTDVGVPIYYHVDTASVGPTFGTSSRIHLYPIPGEGYTFELRAPIVPAPMTSPTEEPVLPNDESVDVAGAILLPIAFDLLLKHPLGRRYSGNNAQLIMRNAEDARQKLRTVFARVQRRGSKQAHVAPGW